MLDISPVPRGSGRRDGKEQSSDHHEEPAGPGERVPPGLVLRRRLRAAELYLPAVSALLASFLIGGASSDSFARGIVLAAAVLGTSALLCQVSFPKRLVMTSRFVFALMPPLAGGFIAGLLALSDAYGLAATGLVPAVGVSIAVALAIEFGAEVLLPRRPLRIAVLGAPTFAAGLRRELIATGSRDVEVVGWIGLEGANVSPGARQLGNIDTVRAVVAEHEIDLLVRGPGADGEAVSQRTYDAIAEGCVDLPVRMIGGNAVYEELFAHVPLGTIDSAWFLFLMHPSFEGTSRAGKRLIDLLGAAIALIFTAPLMLLAAIAIKLEDRGPVLYRQERVGEGGRTFRIFKLRSMRPDAEAEGAQWSISADQRVTRVGRLLRRTHLDEVPQALNVLKGEMTLVGPRPERPEIISELERLLPHYKRRLLVKPGVTGWAQVRCGYAGTELGTAWKLCHDLYYLKHRSTFGDLLIMLETLAIAAKDSHRPLRSPTPDFLFDPEQATGVATFRRAGNENLPPEPEMEPVPRLAPQVA